MDIAQSKRKENIAEYILYLWQVEDLLRALQFSPEAVYSQLVAPRDLPDEQQRLLVMWYMDIAQLLEKEDKEKNGHLEHTLHLIADLNDMHLQLLKLPVGERYRALYAKLEPELPRLKKAVGQEDVSDIEIAFRALYSVVLLRIKGAESDKYIADVLELISPLVAELTRMYHLVERGEIDIFQD